MTYFHAVPNATLIWNHIQFPFKWSSFKLICSSGLEKYHQHLSADLGDTAVGSVWEKTGAEAIGQWLREAEAGEEAASNTQE